TLTSHGRFQPSLSKFRCGLASRGYIAPPRAHHPTVFQSRMRFAISLHQRAFLPHSCLTNVDPHSNSLL
ncbi:hypothetical protein QBC41DRAFT_191448, partial [Cercophora samala]